MEIICKFVKMKRLLPKNQTNWVRTCRDSERDHVLGVWRSLKDLLSDELKCQTEQSLPVLKHWENKCLLLWGSPGKLFPCPFFRMGSNLGNICSSWFKFTSSVHVFPSMNQKSVHILHRLPAFLSLSEWEISEMRSTIFENKWLKSTD